MSHTTGKTIALTLERNYIQKWRFLILYQLVRGVSPPRTSTPSTH